MLPEAAYKNYVHISYTTNRQMLLIDVLYVCGRPAWSIHQTDTQMTLQMTFRVIFDYGIMLTSYSFIASFGQEMVVLFVYLYFLKVFVFAVVGLCFYCLS